MTKKTLFERLPKPFRGAKILLLTHTDLDGEVPAIILKLLFEDVTVKHCSNGTMDYNIRHEIMDDTADAYDFIFITDISCREKSAEWINDHANSSKVILLDHHPSAEYLDMYDWTCVMPELVEDSFRAEYYIGKPDEYAPHSSAASLVYDFFDYLGWFDDMAPAKLELLKKLVHYVASYDTWDWSNIFKRETMDMYYLNVLHEAYGDDVFEESFMAKLNSESCELFDHTDNVVINSHNTKVARHLETVKNNVKTGHWNIEGTYYSITYINCDRFLSETADFLKKEFPDTDLYVTNYGTGLSIRTEKDNINVGAIAAKIGGGGHPGAGGCKIGFDNIVKCVEESTDTTFYFDTNAEE